MIQPVTQPVETVSVGRSRLLLARMAVALTVVPFLVSALVLLAGVGGDYHPSGDRAIEELHTRDVGRHPVLIGLWSREGWSHPGPSLFYVLAVPYRIFGESPVGLAIGALVINALAVVGMAAIAWRRGGMPLLLLTCLGCSVLMRALGADFLRDFWVPDIPVLPFGLLIYLAWSMLCGEAWALPAAVAVASFAIQTHIGYVPLATPLVAAGTIVLIIRAWRGRAASTEEGSATWIRVRRAGLIAAAVGAVMWLPPLLEELQHRPGNIAKIMAYFRKGGALHSLRDGYRVVASQFVLTPGWITGDRQRSPFTGGSELLHSSPAPLLLLPLAGAAFVLWRHRSWVPLRLMAVLFATAVAGVFSVTRTIGTVFSYRLLWSWVLGMVAIVAAAWAAWMELLSLGRRRELHWIARGLVLAVLVLAVLNSTGAARAGTPEKLDSANLAVLLPQVTTALPAGDGDVVVRSAGLAADWYAWGLIAGLEHRGVNGVLSGSGGADIIGENRAHRRGPVRRIVIVAVNGQVDLMNTQPGLRRIAYAGAIGAGERAEVADRLATLRRRHRTGQVNDFEFFTQSGQLTRKLGAAVAVFIDKRSSP